MENNQTQTLAPSAGPSNQIKRSYHAVPPPEDGLVWNRQDGIHWKVGSHSRDRYASSRPPNFTRSLPSHTTDYGSSRTQLGMLPNHLERLRINAGPSNLSISALHYPGTIIEYSLEYIGQLQSLVHPTDVLRQNGYILQELSEWELDGKKRCNSCGKSMRNHKHKKPRSSTLNGRRDEAVESPDAQCYAEPAYGKESNSVGRTPPPITSKASLADKIVPTVLPTAMPISSPQPIIRCKYHDGVIEFKRWSCCGNHISSDPCTGSEFHIPRQYPKGEFEHLWRFHATPNGTKYSDTRQAVAIDCEMGTATSGDSELIRVTLIDYFSSAILVDSLVYPDVEMSHYNTRFSGVTKKDMEMARGKGSCFRGRDQARAAVWRFVGPNTVVVGHSAYNDLTAMRWIHSIVVDTYLIESAKAKAAQQAKEARPSIVVSIDMGATPTEQSPRKGPKGSGALSLKTLARVRLGREIQAGGKKGHDSLEDALAARDLAHSQFMSD